MKMMQLWSFNATSLRANQYMLAEPGELHCIQEVRMRMSEAVQFGKGYTGSWHFGEEDEQGLVLLALRAQRGSLHPFKEWKQEAGLQGRWQLAWWKGGAYEQVLLVNCYGYSGPSSEQKRQFGRQIMRVVDFIEERG